MKKRPALLRGRASNPAGRYFRDIDYRVLFTNKKTTIASPLPHPLPRPHQLPRPHTAEGTVHNISGAHWRTGRAGVGLCPESRGERARGGWFSCLFIEFSRNGSLFTSVRAGRSPGFCQQPCYRADQVPFCRAPSGRRFAVRWVAICQKSFTALLV